MEYMPITPYYARNADEVATLEREATAKRQGEQVQHERGPAGGTRVIRERPDAGAYLIIHDAAEPERQFMAPVPYFSAEPERQAEHAPVAGNAGRPSATPWPEDFYTRWQLIQAAAAELKRAGVA